MKTIRPGDARSPRRWARRARTRRTPGWRRSNTPRGSSAAAMPCRSRRASRCGPRTGCAPAATRACCSSWAKAAAVKLGEHAQFVVEEVERRGVFRAALARDRRRLPLHHRPRSRSHQRRDIAIKVKNVTAGIRGTDVWGKSTDATRPRVPARRQDHRGLRGQSHRDARPAARLLPEAARRARPRWRRWTRSRSTIWSKETEIAPDGPAARVSAARWRVVAAKLAQRDPALALNRSAARRRLSVAGGASTARRLPRAGDRARGRSGGARADGEPAHGPRRHPAHGERDARGGALRELPAAPGCLFNCPGNVSGSPSWGRWLQGAASAPSFSRLPGAQFPDSRAGIAAARAKIGAAESRASHARHPLQPQSRAAPGRHAAAAVALILAGAGSGKTRVLTTRIAYLIQSGEASPAGILAVTFTNKAAREMLTRLSAMLPINTRGMWVGTFHGLCNRLLRTHHRDAGLPQLFQILDSGDQLSLVKRLAKAQGLDEEKFAPRQLQNFINNCKEAGLRANAVEAGDDFTRRMVAFYADYDAQCNREGVVDFAELLLRTFELLSRNLEPAAALPGALPLHPGRRVPGHEQAAVQVDQAAGGDERLRVRGGRRRPVDLPLPRSRSRQHERVRARLRRSRRS